MPNENIRALKITTSKETRDLFREIKKLMEENEGMELTDGQCLLGLCIAYEEYTRFIKENTNRGGGRK